MRGSKLNQRKSPPTHPKALGGGVGGGVGMAVKEGWGRHGDWRQMVNYFMSLEKYLGCFHFCFIERSGLNFQKVSPYKS